MKLRKTYFFVILTVFITLTAARTYAEFPICTDTNDQYRPAVSGNIIVWSDTRNGNYDIYGYDLSTETEFPICTDTNSQWGPAISGDIVVWGDGNGNGDIYGYDLSTETEFTICADTNDQGSPAISGDIVVWQDKRNGNWDIYGYDLSTETEFPICTDTNSQGSPDISGDIVVWADDRNGIIGCRDIYGYDLSTETEFLVCIGRLYHDIPHISGDTVVWRGLSDSGIGTDIYGYDISTETEFTICSNKPGPQKYPAISGDIVVWHDGRDGNYDIYGYDLSTEQEFVVYNCQTLLWFVGGSRPAISGDIVVWEDNRNGNLDIYGSQICLQAEPVQANQTYNGSTTGLTARPDSSSCGYQDTVAKWYSFTPRHNYEYTISLCGSSFDTTLAIFTQYAETELACNDDTEPGVCPSKLDSQLSINLLKDQTYCIRIAGYDGQTGDYSLYIDGPVCADPPQGDLNGDCQVDFADFAVLCSGWLECGWDPQDVCWQ